MVFSELKRTTRRRGQWFVW